MMKRLPLMILVCLIMIGCKKEPQYSDIPFIKFISLEKIPNGTSVDQEAKLVIYLQDGDGDIGLSERDLASPFDTSSKYYYNYFIDYYKKINGEFQRIEFDGVTFNQRIPRLSDKTKEAIEGEIWLNVAINSYDLSTQYDTIMFKCSVVDRKLHESNVIETSELIVKKR